MGRHGKMEGIKLTENITYYPKTWEYEYKGKRALHDPRLVYSENWNTGLVNQLGCEMDEVIKANEIIFLLCRYFDECLPTILDLEYSKCPTFQDWMTKKLKKVRLAQE